MGNDGGSIPKRRELVKSAAKSASTQQIKETRSEALDYAWKTCALSHKPLKAPVVSDAAGKLYNKDAVVEHLLLRAGGTSDDPQNRDKDFEKTVKSLRDVVEVKFQKEEVDGTKNEEAQQWTCPITNKYLGPAVKAVYLVPCGHAFSEIAIKETSRENSCLQCGEPYDSENAVTILPSTPTDIEKSQMRITRLREQGLSHSLKKALDKSKKRKKDKTTGPESTVTPQSTVAETAVDHGAAPPSTLPKQPLQSLPNGIKNSETASLTSRVMAEQDARNKRRRLEGSDNFKSLFSSGNPAAPGKRMDFMTRGYSIPADARR